MADDKTEKKEPGFREQLLDLGKKFDKKIARIKKKAKEEVQQFNDMGGISHVGEYIAQNATSALSQGASALGDNGLVQRIEGRRSQIVSQGKKFDKKVQEEVQQFSDMGGISHVGEYIAQNATSALSQGASALGDDSLAQRIEGRRSQIVAQGKRFDKKVQEEVQQFNDMGGISHVGEYVAQNATSALSQGASALGDDGLVQRIEGRRSQIVAQGKKFDKKVQEEVQQFNDMGGISHVGEYIAQNATSALSQGASALGDNGLVQRIEGRRSQIVSQGKKFDKKVEEEVKQFKQIGGVGEYVAQNIGTGYDILKKVYQQGADAPVNIPASERQSPSVGSTSGQVMIAQGCFVASKRKGTKDKVNLDTTVVNTYARAEVNVRRISDDCVIECSVIDGKKHGAEIIRNAQNQVIDVKLYNHGKPVNLKNSSVDFVQQTDEKGVMHTVCLLNNQPFGTEVYAHPDGKMVATFYEEGGLPMQRKANSQLSINAIDNRKQNESTLLANMTVKQR